MNYNKRVLLFNLLFLIILVCLSLFYPKAKFLQSYAFRAPDILSEVEAKPTAPGETKKGTAQKTTHQLSAGGTLRDYLSTDGLTNTAGNQFALESFMAKLRELQKDKKKKIRIAYLGDSFIEGDLITKDLRAQLQGKFGGTGVGFMPVTSISAGSRQSITQWFSKSWRDVSFKSDDRRSYDLFLSGHAFFANSGSSTSFKPVKQTGLDSFSHMQVLYGTAKDNGPLQLRINDATNTFQPQGKFNVSDVVVNTGKGVTINADASDVPIYGFSFENEEGIRLDNFSFRGISGTELNEFNNDFLTEINAKMPYDLIIIHYGPNLLFKPELQDFSWYKKKMQPVLIKLRAAFPNTSFLMVSTADKAASYNGEWETEKGVEPLVDVQNEMAAAANMDFLNLYHVMGGNGEMIKWVNAQPSLANKDYTHVNVRGAKKIADLLFNALMKELGEFEKVNH